MTLNFWKRGDTVNKPVMVWIHGGSFMHGGSFEPLYNVTNFAAANDVVIVTINYRLNIFGFLNLSSADSVSTMLLTVIPAAKGIFDKVIPQSGHVAFYNDPETSAQFAEKFVISTGAKKNRRPHEESRCRTQKSLQKIQRLQQRHESCAVYADVRRKILAA